MSNSKFQDINTVLFSDSLYRRDAGLTGLLDEITNSSEEGM